MTRMTIRGRRWPTAVLLGLLALALGSVLGVTRNVEAASLVAPANTAPPVVTGTPQVGSTLTTTNGTWSGTTPLVFTYQWQRCDETGGSCSNISGATANTYLLKQVDGGTTLRSRVTATNTDGNDSATSVPTAVIGTTAATGCPTGTGPIQAADLSAPARLETDQQVTSPSLITGSTQQIVAHFRVTACGGRPVQGALVYAAAVPFQQFSVPPEATSAADGTVNLTMNRQRAFPATRQQRLLVIFVRARKSGETALRGVGTSRLVSFPVALAG
jgi:hypothetical protein